MLTCRQGKKISQATVSDLNGLINEIVTLLGIKVTAEEKPAHLQKLVTVVQWIQRRYSTWAIDEIRLAYELAVARQLDVEPFRDIDPNYFGSVMDAFVRFRQDNAQLQQINRNQALLPEAAYQTTPEQIDAYMQQVLEWALQEVKAGGQYPDLGSALYDWLDSKGRIGYTAQQKVAFWNRAADEIAFMTAGTERPTGHLHPTDRARQVKDLASMITGQLTLGAQTRIRAYAKCLALNEWLWKQLPDAEVVHTASVSRLKSTRTLTQPDRHEPSTPPPAS